MKYIIWFFLLLTLGLIGYGYFVDSEYSQKYIGFGVVGLFLVVFPLFSYYRWKDKKVEDYMLISDLNLNSASQ